MWLPAARDVPARAVVWQQLGSGVAAAAVNQDGSAYCTGARRLRFCPAHVLASPLTPSLPRTGVGSHRRASVTLTRLRARSVPSRRSVRFDRAGCGPCSVFCCRELLLRVGNVWYLTQNAPHFRILNRSRRHTSSVCHTTLNSDTPQTTLLSHTPRQGTRVSTLTHCTSTPCGHAQISATPECPW